MNTLTQVGAAMLGASLGQFALLAVFMMKNDAADVKAPDLIDAMIVIVAAMIIMSLFIILGAR